MAGDRRPHVTADVLGAVRSVEAEGVDRPVAQRGEAGGYAVSLDGLHKRRGCRRGRGGGLRAGATRGERGQEAGEGLEGPAGKPVDGGGEQVRGRAVAEPELDGEPAGV